jgi:hypothetical protein
MWRETVATLD